MTLYLISESFREVLVITQKSCEKIKSMQICNHTFYFNKLFNTLQTKLHFF